MIHDAIFTFLLSISPFGEARVGIPFGALNGLPLIMAFTIGLGANLLVFPLFYRLIRFFNKALWPKRWYKKRRRLGLNGLCNDSSSCNRSLYWNISRLCYGNSIQKSICSCNCWSYYFKFNYCYRTLFWDENILINI